MAEWVKWLRQVGRRDRGVVGGKAVGLARLGRMGLLTPGGFCVVVGALGEHVSVNGLGELIGAAGRRMGEADAGGREFILAQVRRAVEDAPLPGAVERELEAAYRQLQGADEGRRTAGGKPSAREGGRVAVRSSAVAEDRAGYSFAGQYESVLGVEDFAGVVAAVKRCWGSLWTLRAWEYRAGQGIEDEDRGLEALGAGGMGVVVQEMVEAEAAGVIFTVEPVGGYRSRLVVEAVAGLGDELVAGRVEPMRLRVARKGRRIVGISDPEGELGRLLDERVVWELAGGALRAERKFGRPVDVEWALKSGEVWFLQARPVTVVPGPRAWADRQVWTNANAGEVLPDVVTPMTWSVAMGVVGRLFFGSYPGNCVEIGGNARGAREEDRGTQDRGLEALGTGEGNAVFGLVAGRAYFNVNTILGVMRWAPRRLVRRSNLIFGGRQGEMFEAGRLDVPPEDVPRIRVRRGRLLAGLPGHVRQWMGYGRAEAWAALELLRERNEQFERLEPAGMSEAELAAAVAGSYEEGGVEIETMGLGKGMVCVMLLRWLCQRWFGEVGLANRLVAGAGGMEDAEAGAALWRLAERARDAGEVRTALEGGGSWEEVARRLGASEAGRSWLAAWGEFMRVHGHHCRGEVELANPRWSERPGEILAWVRGYMGVGDFAGEQERRRRAAVELGERLVGRLRKSWRAKVFRWALENARWGGAFRESGKSQLVRRAASGRRILLELGRRLVARGVLGEAEEVFFLELGELGEAVAADVNDVRAGSCALVERVKARRAEYERNRRLRPPAVVVGRYEGREEAVSPGAGGAMVLEGMGVSPGVARGKARVILAADVDTRVEAGEILVAPFTDPGWTPYFVPAAGIVMELGGVLSHGSIVAREYGKPAVVNVAGAMRKIRTGQELEVDGNRGVVRVIE